MRELIERGTDPAEIVVVDPEEDRLAEAEQLGCNVMQGDSTRDDVLVAIRIACARSVLVSAGRDDTSILIVLTAPLAPDVPISVVVRAEDNQLLAGQPGATNVINPVKFTGLLLAVSAQVSHVADYIADLASVGGSVQLVERPARAEDIGHPLDRLPGGGKGLRIYRGSKSIGFWEDGAEAVQPGDTIIEISRIA